MRQLSGTKEIIFDAAVNLFASREFESVNMREIASACNIKAGSIYNHFAGKQQILETIYDYYTQHFTDTRRPDEEVKRIIRESAAPEEILKALIFTFESEGTKKDRRMILISKIVYMRIFDDERAKEIFLGLMTAEQEKYVLGLIDYGVSIGKLKPFDTKTYASLIVGSRHTMGIKAFAKPGYEVAQLEEEQKLNEFFLKLLPFVF